jgi:hypothetical protein
VFVDAIEKDDKPAAPTMPIDLGINVLDAVVTLIKFGSD